VEGTEAFACEKELLRIAGEWPAERLVEIWNSIPGVKAVTRFKNRRAGVSHVWKAIQSLAKPAPEAKPAPAEKPLAKKAARKKEPKAKGKVAKAAKAAKPAKAAGSSKEAKPARDGSKKAKVLEMISAALGKKMGITVISTKSDSGERTYTVTK
jgi:hypothetical protein